MVLDIRLIDICSFWTSNIRIAKIAIRFSTNSLHYKTACTLTSLFTPCMECCGDANSLRIPMDREESNLKDKESPWRSRKVVFRTTVFVNPSQ